MNKKAARFMRKGPDLLTEELAAALAESRWFEFKPLFLLVHANLRARNSASGCQEMLRLRLYEKLQNFVLEGVAEKRGKEYRGVPASLAGMRERFAAMPCRGSLAAVKAASHGASSGDQGNAAAA